MPIYEYRCPNGHTFELFQKMSDPPADTCVTCGAGPVEKLLFPVAVHFKGSGFYRTDSRNGSSGAVVVQLWHGIPLKRLHLDTGAALRLPLIGSLPGARALMARLYRAGSSRITLFPVASEPVAARVRSAMKSAATTSPSRA